MIPPIAKYTFDDSEPINTTQRIKVSKFDSRTNKGGIIQILSDSTVIIHKSAEINANECGTIESLLNFYGNPENKENNLLKYGVFIGDNKAKHSSAYLMMKSVLETFTVLCELC